MTISTHALHVSMQGDSHIENLTQRLQDILRQSAINDGTLTLFVKHTTAAVMIIEDEPGIRGDTRNFWNHSIPPNPQWEHNTKNPGEDNGHSHLRGQLQGPSIAIPLVQGNLTLGTWQQIFHLECDVRPRDRTLVVTVMGE